MGRDRGPYMLGGVLFKTKGEIERLARRLINELTPYDPIPEEHVAFVLDLFSWHPDYEAMMRPDFVGITVGFNDMGRGLVARSFRALYADGTHDAYSYKTCVRRKTDTPRQRFVQACRTAVIDSVLTYRDQTASCFGRVTCEATGQRLSINKADVHHKGMRFAALVDEFIKSKQIDAAAVEITHEGGAHAEFADTALASEWKQFHDERAELGMVARTERH